MAEIIKPKLTTQEVINSFNDFNVILSDFNISNKFTCLEETQFLKLKEHLDKNLFIGKSKESYKKKNDAYEGYFFNIKNDIGNKYKTLCKVYANVSMKEIQINKKILKLSHISINDNFKVFVETCLKRIEEEKTKAKSILVKYQENDYIRIHGLGSLEFRNIILPNISIKIIFTDNEKKTTYMFDVSDNKEIYAACSDGEKFNEIIRELNLYSKNNFITLYPSRFTYNNQRVASYLEKVCKDLTEPEIAKYTSKLHSIKIHFIGTLNFYIMSGSIDAINPLETEEEAQETLFINEDKIKSLIKGLKKLGLKYTTKTENLPNNNTTEQKLNNNLKKIHVKNLELKSSDSESESSNSEESNSDSDSNSEENKEVKKEVKKEGKKEKTSEDKKKINKSEELNLSSSTSDSEDSDIDIKSKKIIKSKSKMIKNPKSIIALDNNSSEFTEDTDNEDHSKKVKNTLKEKVSSNDLKVKKNKSKK